MAKGFASESQHANKNRFIKSEEEWAKTSKDYLKASLPDSIITVINVRGSVSYSSISKLIFLYKELICFSLLLLSH